ncbi:DUF2235 domain-containing protein [Gymnodinialimonas hymeniacidonis]|uniref:DUF2235 domain-containing protein n=1 Tax=Gymnodinialimonas hymeniacidonis TaxID=3126508 RepID=UPI0034C6B898
MRLSERISGWLRGLRSAAPPAPVDAPRSCTHVILLDGTMSSLTPGCETNIGLTFCLLQDLPTDSTVRLYYEPGIQWRGVLRAHEVMAGIGINRQIKRAYAWLATGYKPGDRIFLMGYSRGAYAVRSLGGLIDRMGLLRRELVAQGMVEEIYSLYREDPEGAAAQALSGRVCFREVPIRFLGAYDTVRALGIRYPLVWRFLPLPHPYHSHTLGDHVEVARQALALDETRVAYAPVLWDTTAPNRSGRDVRQVWFKGNHGDIGGQLNGRATARPRSNISLVWMLEEVAEAGLSLPVGWQGRFQTDHDAPSIGNFAGFGKLFWARRRRVVGVDPSERLHPSAKGHSGVPTLDTNDTDGQPAPG